MSRSPCWKSTATFCATFAATPCIRPRCGLLDELGLWERFAALPHSEVHSAKFESDGRSVTYVDFGRLRQPHPFVAMVPQWDLLNLLADAAQAEPSFTLRMNTEATGLLREGGRVTGVRYQGPEGPGELRAELTVACDGRWSIGAPRGGSADARIPGELRRVVVQAAARRRSGILLLAARGSRARPSA